MENDNSLGKVERALNRPDGGIFRRKRTHLHEDSIDVPSGWEAPTEENMKKQKRVSGVRLVFLVAVVFFLGALAFSSFLFLGKTNVVSGDKISISVNGPIAVKGGEVATFEIMIANQNAIEIELASLVVQFPAGTRDPAHVERPLTRHRRDVGTVKENQVVRESVKGIFFGETGSEQEIVVEFEYRTKGSNAIFVKSKTFSFLVGEAPVALLVMAPKDINAGQNLKVSIELSSQSTETLSDMLAHVQYPPGFVFERAEPVPVAGSNNVWRLGNLSPGAERTVTVYGVMEGQEEEVKTFHVTAGAGGNTGDTAAKVVVPYSTVSHTVNIKRPFVSMQTVVAGSIDEVVSVEGAQIVNGSIAWKNNLPTRVMDGELLVRIRGSVLDARSVSASQGFYRSSDSTLLWNKSTASELAIMEPGASGSLTFSFASQPLLAFSGTTFRNPELDLEFVFVGTRVADATIAGGRVETVVRRKVKFNTVTQLGARAVHHVGPIANTGPLPPKVGEETTYTIIWSLVNSSNDVTLPTVRATLPSYIRFIGGASPADEKVQFDSRAGEVVWDMESVKAGAGLTVPVREVAFQIGFTPSVSQANLVIPLTGDVVFSGTDDFTKARRVSSRPGLTTELLTDAKSQEGEYRVRQ